MKIEVPYENSQAFQNFGHSAQFKIQDTETGKILSSEIVSTNAANATFRNQIGIWKLMLFRDRKSTRLNSSHSRKSRMPSSA